MRDPRLYLNDIVCACDRIVEFIGEMPFDAFVADEKTKRTVAWQLQIIGEASRQMPEELRQEHPQIAWKDIIGMRNVLTHGYFGVDYQAVWDAFLTDIPALKNGC